MESVRDKRTREIVEAEDLWLFDSVDAEGYVCWGCGIEMPLYSLMPSGLKLIEQRPVVDPSATGCENNSSTIRSASSTSGESNSPVMALQRKLKSSLVFSHFSTSLRQ
ncbi:hypothetical protein [Pectobacterium sp. CHL-2024]|uniref:hypothetical protein n=1 Tax=Pectobacterium sp. CHL-2024 TaxID=3377079 RepID=UPI003827B147